jgi:hypothetical protein
MMVYILSLMKNFQMIMSAMYENPLLQNVRMKISNHGLSGKIIRASEKLSINAWASPT